MNITDVLADVNVPEGEEGEASLDLDLGKVTLSVTSRWLSLLPMLVKRLRALLWV